MAQGYTYGGVTFEAPFQGRGSASTQALDGLFNEGVVKENVLSEVAYQIFAGKLLEMVKQDHPVAKGLKAKLDAGTVDNEGIKESIESLVNCNTMRDFLGEYHEEKAVNQSLQFTESNAAQGLVLNALNLTRIRRSQNDDLGFDDGVLRTTLPRLAEQSYNEALNLVQKVIALHQQTNMRSRA